MAVIFYLCGDGWMVSVISEFSQYTRLDRSPEKFLVSKISRMMINLFSRIEGYNVLHLRVKKSENGNWKLKSDI